MTFKKCIMVLMGLILCSSVALAAGSSTQTYTKTGSMTTLVLAWTGAASGGAFTAVSTKEINGVVCGVEVNPGTTAPTADYDITISTTGGMDIMGGALADRSATATEFSTPYDAVADIYLCYPVAGSLTIAITNNSVNSATGTITIYYWEQ